MRFLLAVVALVAIFLGFLHLRDKDTPPVVESTSVESTSGTQIGCERSGEEQMTSTDNTIIMEISTGGQVVIKTFPDKAPNHVARFKELACSGFYDGIVFHRVIEGFMAQTGDPTGTGMGGSGQNIDAEFNDVAHTRGIVSTARSADPNSADSQFFIMLADAPHLDGQYTAWGEVVSGMEHIDAIPKGPRGDNGVVPMDERASIVSMRVVEDDEGEPASEGE